MNFCLTNYSWAITWQPSYLSFFRIAHKSSASNVFSSLWCFTATSSNEPLNNDPAYYHHPNRFMPQCAFIDCLSFIAVIWILHRINMFRFLQSIWIWILHCIYFSPSPFSILLWDSSSIPQNNTRVLCRTGLTIWGLKGLFYL